MINADRLPTSGLVPISLTAILCLFCFVLLMASPPLLFLISDQQHFVFCLAAHINVLVPPICKTFQQRDLPHMDSPGCGR